MAYTVFGHSTEISRLNYQSHFLIRGGSVGATLFRFCNHRRIFFKLFYTLLFSGCLSGVASTAFAAIMGINPLVAFTDKGENPAPNIELKNRLGSEAFANVALDPGPDGLKKLAQIARDAITKYPESGLAHEVLGTVLFYSGDMKAALNEFTYATKVEPKHDGSWVKLGITQMESGFLDQAEASLKTALSLNTENRIANQRLGLLYEHQQKFGAAIEFLQKSLRNTSADYLGVAPNLAQLFNREHSYQKAIELLAPRVPLTHPDASVQAILAASYLGARDFNKAVERYRRAVDIQPESKEFKLGLANSQRQANQLNAASDTLKKLIAKHPDWKPAYLEQGELALAMNNLAEAERSFSAAVSKGADAASVDYKIAQYYLAKKQVKEALARLRQGVDRGVVQVETYIMMAELERSQNNLDAGLAILRAGVEKFPQNSLLQFRTGSEFAALRRYEEALAYFDRAHQLSPQDVDILRAYSLVQNRLGKTKAAAATAGKLYQLRRDKTPEALFYASLLQQDKQLAEAAALYESVLEREPENLVALNNLATLLAEQGKLIEAEKAARKANNLIKGNVQLLDTLGWILHQQKRYSEALELLNQALKISPDIAVTHYHTGVVHGAMGNANEAKKFLEKALALDSNSYWAEDAKKRLEKK
jgi:tetratricopeptide (TPR) repeat protein